jgi:transcriptional regulator with PAS, ATPase and Fis domain
VGVEENSFQCQQVESALKESEERFRQMAEMTGEWLWEQDPRGYYIYSSTAVNQILGFSQDEVIGKHYTEFLTPQDQAEQHFYSASHQPFYALTNQPDCLSSTHKENLLCGAALIGILLPENNFRMLS